MGDNRSRIAHLQEDAWAAYTGTWLSRLCEKGINTKSMHSLARLDTSCGRLASAPIPGYAPGSNRDGRDEESSSRKTAESRFVHSGAPGASKDVDCFPSFWWGRAVQREPG
jgi:hypothetical protein